MNIYIYVSLTKVFLFTSQILVVIVASQQTPSKPPYNIKPHKCFSLTAAILEL